MAIIHQTTMSPGKLELLTAWLPAQPWYLGGRAPELAKAGGFRLDDPQGEVGIEFMLVTDGDGDGAVTYQVPLTYRSCPLDGAASDLIGTARHGVLGPRWIYDGTRDPVLVAQLVALIHGQAEPQAQSISHTPDPTVTSWPVGSGSIGAIGSVVTAGGPSGTDLQVEAGDQSGLLTVRLHRVLRPGDETGPTRGAWQPCVSAPWRLPDGTQVRGVLASAHYTPRPSVTRPASS
jgi:Maltokinase N-terminal cap domain